MVRWKKQTSVKCPRCDAIQEDKEHIIRCPQEAAKDTWTEAIKTLEAWLKHEQTDPQLTTLITTGLQAWRTGNPPPQDSSTAQQQNRIGWDKVLDGWLTLAWREQQEVYWAQWKSRKSSKWWTTELIKNCGTSRGTCGITRMKLFTTQKYTETIFWLVELTNKFAHSMTGDSRQYPGMHSVCFEIHLEVLISNPLCYKEQWVTLVQVAMRRKQCHEHRAYLSKQQGMRCWRGLKD